MQDIIDLLKAIVGVAIVAIIADYWFNRGPPPRGRGRWRNYSVIFRPQGGKTDDRTEKPDQA